MSASKQPREDWMNIGRDHWEGKQDTIRRAVTQTVVWHDLPWHDAPFCPGEGIKALIKEFRIPKVKRVGVSNELAPYGLYGIEGNYKNGRALIFAVDEGSVLTPILCLFHEKEGGTP